ncbi:glycosyltransferase family 2 protein [Devosia sp. SL43]|nr:glycosyltransferase family 2 protein [Devosia sp. SL43]
MSLTRVKSIGASISRALAAVRRKGVLGSLLAALRIAKSEGLAGLWFRLGAVEHGLTVGVNDEDYARWIELYDRPSVARREALLKAAENFARRPLVSVVMPTFNPDLRHLEEAIRSVQDQIYPNWELCIADDLSTAPGVREALARWAAQDSRIKIVLRTTNGHICAASNSGLEIAEGDYVALLDHDDTLPDHALFYIVEAINRHPDGMIFYTDEDKITDSGIRCQPYFKSDWNYDLFLSHNMVSHLGVYNRRLLVDIGGFREGLHGSQDWDLALRACERISSSQIVHVPRILYHWRIHPQSTSANGQTAKPYAYVAAERALNDHFGRAKIAASAKFIPQLGSFIAVYDLPATLPKVSIIIPTRNGHKHLARCVESILELTTYTNFEILIVDNGSDEAASLAYLDEISVHPYVRLIRDSAPFNYSRINNQAVAQARGELVALVNDDVQVISPDWLSEMVSIALQEGVGAVGAKLYYGNDTVQHAGIVVGVNGIADHVHLRIPRHFPGYFSKAMLIQSFSAVTAACLVVRKSAYQQVGGLDEVNLTVAFNDVDFCLRLMEAGYRNVWTPQAELYHHESLTRGAENTPEKQVRFQAEIKYMQERWATALSHDFAYNPNLDKAHANYTLAWPPAVPVFDPAAGT